MVVLVWVVVTVSVAALLQALRNAMEPMVAPPTTRPASLRNSLRDICPFLPSFLHFSFFSFFDICSLPFNYFGLDTFRVSSNILLASPPSFT